MNWFKNARFRNKFLFAFGIPLAIVVFLSIYASVKISNVESAFVSLTDGPNRRLIYASDAIAELANCRRCILAMGYMTENNDYINASYSSYKSSAELIIRYLDEYHRNLINDPYLRAHEKENREVIISGVKEMFTGVYQDRVEQLYIAAIATDRAAIDAILADGLPMGDEMMDTLWQLRGIVQEHLDFISAQTQAYTKNAVLTLVLIAVGLVILSVAVSLKMSDVIRVPIVRMERGMQEIAKGNLQYPIRSMYKDELGRLSNQIGDMVDTISLLNKAVVIVDSVDELILVTDLECNLLFVNNKFEETYSTSREVCLGRKCHEVIYGLDSPCSFCSMPYLLENIDTFPSASWQRQYNDITLTGRTSIVRWVDGTLTQITTAKDDTLRIEHEEQQKEHARQLREAVLAAEEASRAKSIFLASMSHEIRTPMNAVMGLSELILRARKSLTPEVYENALAIRSASLNLLSIINDLLDLSKIESGKLEIIEEDYEFSSLINDLISIVRVRIAEKPIVFIVDIDPNIPEFLTGDEARIRQAVLNLLVNAVKYTQEGYVALTVSGEIDPENRRVILTATIADSGIGIKEESIASLFDEFVRVDTEKNKAIEGTGLGLPISLKLCEAMGGGITVKSEYGKGSVFTVTLPQKIQEYQPVAQVYEPENMSVLLLEPRPLIRDSVKRALDSLGVRCEAPQDAVPSDESTNIFTHVFIGASESKKLNGHWGDSDNPPEIIFMTEFMDAPAHKGARVLALPVHSLSISNVLNNEDGRQFDVAVTNETFIAPGASILIVDDMMSNLLVAKGLMAPYEMDITTCMSGEEALSLVAENSYDLIFMDHMMPKMDGLETTKRIREMPGEYFAKIPIVALTANAVSGMREMFIVNGMNDFLAKPIETAKLNTVLEKWIPARKRKKKTSADEEDTPPAEESEFYKALQDISDLSVGRAVSLLGGSPETYEDVFKISVRLLPDNVSRLDEFIGGDIKSYEIEIHGVKGVLRNIGAYELGKAAYELEMLAKKGDEQACRRLHAGFIERLNAFIAEVSAIAGAADSSEKSAGDIGVFLAAADKIAEAIEFYNATDALEILSEMCEYTYGQEIDDAAAVLTRALEYFDFDAAAESLSALKGALEADGSRGI